MAFWSRLRSLLGLEDRPLASENSDSGSSSQAPGRSESSGRAAKTSPGGDDQDGDSPADAAVAPLPGVIDDWNAATATGLITLTDGAEVLFGREACREFTPLIGLRIEVLATGVPPVEPTRAGPQSERCAIALWATRLRLALGSESEYAARLRISQVERAVRGRVDRVINQPTDPAAAAGAPPWARHKGQAGKLPAGPSRPQDAFFALTVVLGQELTDQPRALAALLRSSVWPEPTVRLIPLARKGQREHGFSAEVVSGTQRAFLLYRPLPYAAADTPPQGHGHVGLFIGGPLAPRALAQLSPGTAPGPLPLSASGEPRLLSALARSLLKGDADSLGLVVNRADKAWKPREIALNQLGPDPGGRDSLEDGEDGEDGDRVPFLLWIDWNVGERSGLRCQKSCGMESLGLPDVAVFFTDEHHQDRARDALWFACHELAAGRLLPEERKLSVPRQLQLQPGSRLLPAGSREHTVYQVRSRNEEWLELIEAGPSSTAEPPPPACPSA